MSEVKKDIAILSSYERLMKDKGITEVYLLIEKDLPEDVGKDIIRLDEETRRELGVNLGDKVDIIGPKVSTGQVEEALPNDIGKKVVRIDKKLREDAMLAVDIQVCLRKAIPRALE